MLARRTEYAAPGTGAAVAPTAEGAGLGLASAALVGTAPPGTTKKAIAPRTSVKFGVRISSAPVDRELRDADNDEYDGDDEIGSKRD